MGHSLTLAQTSVLLPELARALELYTTKRRLVRQMLRVHKVSSLQEVRPPLTP